MVYKSLLLFSCLQILLCIRPISCTKEHADGIVEWVRSRGGYFSDKLEIRPMWEGASALGVYALENIEVNETLIKIPKDCYITVESGYKATNHSYATLEEAIVDWHKDYCSLAKKIRQEMNRGESSEYGPYMEYLKIQQRGQTPATWSDAGKKLLKKLVPEQSDAVDWIDLYHKNQTGAACFDDSVDNDPELEHLLGMVVQRGYDSLLVPIWDMVNHDNGEMNTATNSLHGDDIFEVWASYPIEAGLEVYHSYDTCLDCTDTSSWWGTIEILRDFGFVEEYPQRWVFWQQRVWFEIWELYEGWEADWSKDEIEEIEDYGGDDDEDDEDKDEDEEDEEDEEDDEEDEEDEEDEKHYGRFGGVLKVFWDVSKDSKKEQYGLPDEKGIQFLQDYLQQVLAVDIEEEARGLPDGEKYMVTKLHETASLSLRMAIKDALKKTGSSKHDEL